MRPEKLHIFSMCRQTAARLVAGALDGVLHNALLDSYAIHLRSLIEFLYDEPKRPADLRAIHFVQDYQSWLKARGGIREPLRVARERAQKQIVHFTKKRFADGAVETHWRPGLEISALAQGLHVFVKHAHPDKLHPLVAQAVDGLASLPTQRGE